MDQNSLLTLVSAVYYNDSVAQVTFAYDFDLESGNILNKRTFLDRRRAGGEPDGMVIEYVPAISNRADCGFASFSS